MNNGNYVLCARMQENSIRASEYNEAAVGQALNRCLNRIERVASSFSGRITRRASSALLITFSDANNAALAACDMQRQCADVPQFRGSRLALQVGIHKASAPLVPETRKANGFTALERRDPLRRFGFDTAGRLSVIAQPASIALSNLVLIALNPALQAVCSALSEHNLGIPVYQCDWRREVPSQSSCALPSPPTNSAKIKKLRISQGAQRFDLAPPCRIASLGRDPGCDVRVLSRFASRVHALFELHPDVCLFIDQSANGTHLNFENGESVRLKAESYALTGRTGRGQLLFGRDAPSDHALTFEVFEV